MRKTRISLRRMNRRGQLVRALWDHFPALPYPRPDVAPGRRRRSRVEVLEDRRLLAANVTLDLHEHGPAGVDFPFGVFTAEEVEALESVPELEREGTVVGDNPIADGSHEDDILTFVVDFKESGQGNTTDVFGNEITTFDVTSYGFSAGSFDAVVNSIMTELDEDYFSELIGTVAGPTGRDLQVDFITGDIGVAPAGVSEYYYIQVGTVIAGPHSGGTLGVAAASGVRDEDGNRPGNRQVGDVVGSVFTNAIQTLGGLTPSNALISGNVGFTTFAIGGTLSHEIGHTLSLSHINNAQSVQPTPGLPPTMGTGAIDLPNQARIGDREFSLSGFDGENGNAPRNHVAQLVDAVGLHNTEPGSIAGFKFNDANGNAVFDAAENGLEGWTIYADLNSNGLLDAGEPFDVTGTDGSYLIENVSDETVTVREIPLEALISTVPVPPPLPTVQITEMSEQGPDFFEIQNVTSDTIDTSGWFVAASLGNDGDGDINNVHPDTFSLPPSLFAGEIVTTTDSPNSPNFWGSNLNYVTGTRGWVLLVDDQGNVQDELFIGFTAEQIALFDITVNSISITAADLAWIGDGVPLTTSSSDSYQRVGDRDSDSAFDFMRLPITQNLNNNNLVTPFVPFPGGITVEVFGGLTTNDVNFGALAPQEFDFGDAPDSYGTNLTSDGARHELTGPKLGALRDAELNGAASFDSLGDDTAGSDDEDGIVFTSGNLVASVDGPGVGTVDVTLQDAGAASNLLDGWIDFNGDGDWDDAGEQIFTSFDLGTVDGTSSLTFAIPQLLGQNVVAGDTYSRFRLSTQGGLSPTGLAVDGEVEDHLLTIDPTGQWISQGPNSITDGQVENITPDDQVSGAVHTVLAHPTDPDILYLGATNGGVWKTTDATSTRPTWTNLTDSLPSQSIGALAFDLGDATGETVYAGVGRYSSFGRIGNDRVGLYRTTDGGANWTILDDQLVGANISGIAANGNNVVVSVNVADSFTFNNIGIFRSTDAGVTFTRVSDGDGSATGLPGGVSYDLVADPTDPNVLYTSTVFSDNVGGTNGIYKSIDGGASWSKVSDAAIDALIVSGETSNLELAVGEQNNVYAAVINFGDMQGLFRSGDGGATWTQMDTPQTNENGTNVGLNPRGQKGPGPDDNPTPAELAGGQGAIHFSIVADPNDANIVYVGGDRQPRSNGDTGSFPNSIGATDFTGRLFRGDATQPAGSQFVHLTHSDSLGAAGGGTASSSSPHADSREMVFDANGDLIEVDDGGIYRRTSPQDNTGDWFGIIGNLQVTEIHDVAYDSLSNTIMSGNQDTGTTFQPSDGAEIWDSLSTADGGDIVVDNVSLAGLSQSVRYSSFQNLGAFRRTVWDASGNLIGQSFPSLSGFGGDGVFRTPVELNAVDPNRLVIQGGTQTYETFDQGANVTGLSEAPNGGISQNAVAYGGRRQGVDNPDVLWVGSESDVYVRTDGVSVLDVTPTDPTTETIRDLAIDPEDWATAYVIDSDSVFATDDVGASWADVTGNLMSFASSLRSLAFVGTSSFGALVAGTNAGVFASIVGNLGTWTPLGGGLPNVITYDLDYDPVDDVLVAGTLGRGAWSLENVTASFGIPEPQLFVTLDASDSLFITDLTHVVSDDVTLGLDLSAGNYVISASSGTITTDIPGALGDGTSEVTVPFSAAGSGGIGVDLLGGNDLLTIDLTAGALPKPVDYVGERLVVEEAGNFQGEFDVTSDLSGQIRLTGNQPISYTSTEEITYVGGLLTVDVNYGYDSAVGLAQDLTSQLLLVSEFGTQFNLPTPQTWLNVTNPSAAGNLISPFGLIDMGDADIELSSHDIVLSGADITTHADGEITLTASRNVTVRDDSSLQSVNGPITLSGNLDAIEDSGDFDGVFVDASLIQSTNGDITLTGRGGTEQSSGFNRGILITNSAIIESLGTGVDAAAISLIGQGGQGTLGNRGVQLSGDAPTIQSIDGPILVRGDAGGGSEDFHQGVILFSGNVVSSGVGEFASTITIEGTGGNGVNSNDGILLQNAETLISSIDGDIRFVGTGAGTGDFNRGVRFTNSPVVESIGTGDFAADIYVTGEGAGATLGRGVQLSGSAPELISIDGDIVIEGIGQNTSGSTTGVIGFSGLIQSSGSGDVSVTGTAEGVLGAGIDLLAGTEVSALGGGNLVLSAQSSDPAVVADLFMLDPNGDAQIGQVGTGNITIHADSVAMDSARVTGSGVLSFVPRTESTSIGLGGGAGLLNLSDTELANIDDGFGMLRFGDELSGSGRVEIGTTTLLDDALIVGGEVDVEQLTSIGNAVELIARTGDITDGFQEDESDDIIAATLSMNGNVTPGRSLGVLLVDGEMVLAEDSELTIEIESSFIEDDYDGIRTTGAFSIEPGVGLQFVGLPGYVAAVGDEFVIVRRDGGGGTFEGLPEGARVQNIAGTNLQATITYAGGDGDDIAVRIQPGEVPRIVDVTAGSTEWTALFSPAFIDSVDGDSDSGLGVSLPGEQQLRNLPWINLNRIHIVFTEDVGATFTKDNVKLVGSNVADYLVDAELTFDPVTYVGTIELPTNLSADRLRLGVLDSVESSQGFGIDGEWEDEVSQVSGDGTVGGGFSFRFDVLPGDTVESDFVLGSDVIAVRDAQSSVAGLTAYDPYYDVDGSGVVLGSDVIAVRDRQVTYLPFTDPPEVLPVPLDLATIVAAQVDEIPGEPLSAEAPFDDSEHQADQAIAAWADDHYESGHQGLENNEAGDGEVSRKGVIESLDRILSNWQIKGSEIAQGIDSLPGELAT